MALASKSVELAIGSYWMSGADPKRGDWGDRPP